MIPSTNTTASSGSGTTSIISRSAWKASLSGWIPAMDQAAVERQLKGIVHWAGSAGFALAPGTCFLDSGETRCDNEIRFCDGAGAFFDFHISTLLCGSLKDPPQGVINHYGTRPLETLQIKKTSIGGLICNVTWGNPQCVPMPDGHLSQQLSESGMPVSFHATNGHRNGGE